MDDMWKEKPIPKYAKDYLERLLCDYPLIKEGLKELDELKELAEKGDLPIVNKAYAVASGCTLNTKPKTEEERVFIRKYKGNFIPMVEQFGVPCRNRVERTEFCAAFFIPMSKCVARENKCPLMELGLPAESHDLTRMGQWFSYNYPEIQNEIVDYLEKGEWPQPSLLTFPSKAWEQYKLGKDYLKGIKKDFKPTEKKREAFSVRLRFKILNRDNFTCKYCGRTASDGVKLHVDHILPVAKGGTNDEENLTTSCQDCNLGKSDNLLEDNQNG